MGINELTLYKYTHYFHKIKQINVMYLNYFLFKLGLINQKLKMTLSFYKKYSHICFRK